MSFPLMPAQYGATQPSFIGDLIKTKMFIEQRNALDPEHATRQAEEANTERSIHIELRLPVVNKVYIPMLEKREQKLREFHPNATATEFSAICENDPQHSKIQAQINRFLNVE